MNLNIKETFGFFRLNIVKGLAFSLPPRITPLGTCNISIGRLIQINISNTNEHLKLEVIPSTLQVR